MLPKFVQRPQLIGVLNYGNITITTSQRTRTRPKRTVWLEYKRYENQHAEIYTNENSDRAFEEEVMLSGFGNAQVKGEGSGVSFDEAQETFTARYTHETVALAFAITEEAIEDNLYDRLAARYTKALARSMSNAKQVKAVEPLINGLPSTATFKSGDGKALFATDHPTVSGTFKNT